jgi:hypothetical protein
MISLKYKPRKASEPILLKGEYIKQNLFIKKHEYSCRVFNLIATPGFSKEVNRSGYICRRQ